MANINIYGTLFSDASKANDKVIVLGSQVYGNDTSAPAKDESGVYPETGKLISKNEFKGLLGTDWTSGLVPGSQYDINRFFKAKINNISANYVPYTGATKDVDLGSWRLSSNTTIRATQFDLNYQKALSNITVSQTSSNSIYLLIEGTTIGGTAYNCVSLEDFFKKTTLMVTPTTGGTHVTTLMGHIGSLYDKVNHITQPLRFKGVINTGGKLPGLNEGVEVGDVYHFNADVDPYNIGDEVVYVGNTPGVESPWELLGQNITPIPTDDINFKNLES